MSTAAKEGKDGVLYFNHGVRHCARLLVSAYSLRRYYSGPVCILDTGDSGGIVDRIASDPNIRATVRRMPLHQLRRHSAYVTKTTLHRHTPFEVSLYLDADTLVVASLDDLFPLGRQYGFVATRFANWNCRTKVIKNRIQQWVGLESPWGELAASCLKSDDPAVNTGVFVMRRDDHLLDEWHDLAKLGWRLFIPDEISMQLLLHAATRPVLDDRWNSSPLYGSRKDDTVCWHFHGSKHLRPEARPTWLPVFDQVWRDNVAYVRGWAPADDGALAEYLDEVAEPGDVELAESSGTGGTGGSDA